MQKLAIIGGGDLGQLIAHHAKTDNHYEVAGYFDDTQPKGTLVKGLPVIGALAEIEENYNNGFFDCLMIGIGYRHFQVKKDLYNKYIGKIPFGSVFHSSAYIDKSSKIGNGVFILPGCVLDYNTVIEDNVLLNTGTTIAHDSRVRIHSFLSPRVAVAGFVNIGECCNIGIGTIIIDNINISEGVQTGGGTVVTNHLTEKGLYVGVPARLIKRI